MSTYLGGLASLERWEGLKEWHRRHQDLLGEQGLNSSSERHDKQFQSEIVDNQIDVGSSSVKDISKDQIFDLDVPKPSLLKHDLSMIPEADEDSRSRDGDIDAVRSKQKQKENWTAPIAKTSSIIPEGKNLTKSSERNVKQPDIEHNFPPGDKAKKRAFLKKGQGLVKYNLKPEDVKHPYQMGSVRKTFGIGKELPKSSIFALKSQEKRSSEAYSMRKDQPANILKPSDLKAPMPRLVLSAPTQKFNPVEIGTWSQVFGRDLKPVATENSSRELSSPQLPELNVQKPVTQQQKPYKSKNYLSPSRKVDCSNKPDSSPEEDQESLAAYLDLEQHVGNASFCSTSSKVDRLLAKSSKPTIHQSNPDAITQSKQLTPVKTGRKFFNRDSNNLSEDNVGMWSTSDLESLIKERARRSGSLIKSYVEPIQKDAEAPIESTLHKHPCVESSLSKVPMKAVARMRSCEQVSTLHEQQDIDWMLETIGPTRKPHLMKTMPSIDLDSSLIKNALTPTPQENNEESDSESESSSSSCSSEEDFDDFTSGMDGCLERIPPKQPPTKSVETSQPFKEVEPVTKAPMQLVDDAALQQINHQIETHLATLREEIETLQSAKKKTQKYTAGLEKKVQDLEQRLMLEARSFHKRLEDEREAAAKRLSEELGKLLKEKQALQKQLREERRKAPDPITQQELLNMKQEIAQWEEKWRTDRAKARGLESNLRIQISNLRKENEKLKDENSKLRRERETVLSTAKAKAASNTRVINSIAQQLGNSKPKITILREENPKAKFSRNNSAYNFKTSQSKTSTHSGPVATIEKFPKVSHAPNEWSTDEEVDLGKETSDEEEILSEAPKGKLQNLVMVSSNVKSSDKNSQVFSSIIQEPIDLEEAQAKYDAIFGNCEVDPISDVTNSVAEMDQVSGHFPQLSGEQGSPSNDVESKKVLKSIPHPDGRLEQVKEDGTREIIHSDGTWEQISTSGSIIKVPPSGWPVHVLHPNGDRLEKLSDGTTKYFYAKTNVWEITHPDGHGEWIRQSGHDGPLSGKVEKLLNGDTVIFLSNGEREIHTQEYMKREFPDGTVKFVFNDGSQKTQYPSGRVRFKDAQGRVKDSSLT